MTRQTPETDNETLPTTAATHFRDAVLRQLPEEAPYAYHERLTTEPVHVPRRAPEVRPAPDDVLIEDDWRIIFARDSSDLLRHAVADFQDYLRASMAVTVELEEAETPFAATALPRCIQVGTREQMPDFGDELTGSKDYELVAADGGIVVCGYDDRGAMQGLFNLEARMNLREAPCVAADLHTVRHSLYQTRMALSWMGWMEWPDTLLSHMAHDGFDGIFASVYANPNGDRTTAENSTEFYARLLNKIRHQDPNVMRDLIDRAARVGIKVYAPIIYQYLGTPESEAGLRALVRNILGGFPDIRGYVLLTEGFWYGKWGGGHGADRDYLENWAREWSRAVGIVTEECHRIDPEIEILPWEYNIDFRPRNVEMKRYFIQQLPSETIPMLTWENGKSFEIDGMQGFLRDYSLNQIGPAEVTDAQIGAARERGMRVYCKADSFASWQFGTIPYLPFPYQWTKRYEALERYGVNGTLESWSSGYKPNWVAELRAWYCWTDRPSLDDLLRRFAAREFGKRNADIVIEAWKHFSDAIKLVPDTGPRMGTNSAVGNPIFFEKPPPRTATFNYSWKDQNQWMGYLRAGIVPEWPFTAFYLIFCPDFTNRTNRAESYARTASGVQTDPDTPLLPTFLKYLRMAAAQMEKGLALYRQAALNAPPPKQQRALREVVVAEQLQRMILSNAAILEFEDLRFTFVSRDQEGDANALIDRMEQIVKEEIERTELSLVAATHDSRLGFQFEQDYVYTPYSLREKLAVLRDTLERQLPNVRKNDP
jgi:hypothetical protein